MSEPPRDATLPPSDLHDLRERIETVDRSILELFQERMRVAENIAQAKIEAAYPLRDQLREEQVLQSVRHAAAELDLDPHQMESIFRLIFEMAISHQQSHLRELATTPLRVAYQGVEGSHSHLAAQRRYRDRPGGILLSGFETFHEAADSVRNGTTDFALLPIENSSAGSINETYDLLTEGDLSITAEVIARISHSLLALPGTSEEEIVLVLSHPQALRQCEDFLRARPWMRPQVAFDTAGAARKVREGNDPSIGAIAGDSAARSYGLEVVCPNIQNQQGNYTRFVEVSLQPATCPPDAACKTSLMLATGHRPGDLADVLRHFADRSVNMTKLESRPVPDRPFQYRFYLDVEGHASSSAVSAALSAIAPHTRELTVLGTYPRAEIEPAEAMGETLAGDESASSGE